jgi:hypothetical protein
MMERGGAKVQALLGAFRAIKIKTMQIYHPILADERESANMDETGYRFLDQG